MKANLPYLIVGVMLLAILYFMASNIRVQHREIQSLRQRVADLETIAKYQQLPPEKSEQEGPVHYSVDQI